MKTDYISSTIINKVEAFYGIMERAHRRYVKLRFILCYRPIPLRNPTIQIDTNW